MHAALGDARRVVNVGAGAGSYEPKGREVVAVEPSAEMISQRRGGTVVRAIAEALPFRTSEFDAALAVLTVHHWLDVAGGLGEMRRVADRAVVLAFDPAVTNDFWLAREYVPAIGDLDRERAPSVGEMVRALGGARVEPLPIAHDCTDGFLAAYWRRPQCYLDPAVRGGISCLAQLSPEEVDPGMRKLEADLASGAWVERHADLLAREDADWGYRLLVAE